MSSSRKPDPQTPYAEAAWRSLLDASPDAVVLLDGQDRILLAGAAAERVFAAPAESLLGRGMDELVPGWRDTPHSERAVSVEVVARRAEGTTFPARLSRAPVSARGLPGTVVVVADISARRRTEARLREREEQLQLMFQNAPTGIATVDLDGRFLTVNQGLCRILGYSEAELLQRTVDNVTHPEDLAMARRRRREFREGRIDRYRTRKRYIRKDGRIVDGLMNAALVHDAEGRPSMFVGQVEDITDRLRAERELRESRERLAHVTRLQTVSEMAAGIAHEINQPLTAISVYAEASRRLIRSGNSDSGELLEALERIGRQAQRAGDVVRRLKGLVRRRESTRSPADLNELAREIVKLAEIDARLHGASIRMDLAGELPRTVVDPVQIQQVVLNLVLNGMEAMAETPPEDRVITVRTRATAAGAIEIGVEDRGSGVTREAEQNLFRTFFTTKPAGTGMGLAISRTILEAHGGRLWFTRNPDRGTTFRLSVPVVGEEENDE